MAATKVLRRGTAHQRSSHRYTVNSRLLLITLVLFAVVLPAGYLWYRYQLLRTASAFLVRAEKLEEERDFAGATSYYQRYLAIFPEDTPALVKLVTAYAAGEASPTRVQRLNNMLYQALGRVPDRHDLRRMLAENLLKANAFEEAETEAQKLLEEAPEEAPAARKVIAISQLARARTGGQIDFSTAIAGLLAAAEESPGDLQLIAVTANTLRDQDVPERPADAAAVADRLMDQLIATDPESVSARITRCRYRLRFELPDPDGDLQKALELDPDNVDALLLSARSADSTALTPEQRSAVEASLRRVIELSPDEPRAYELLAQSLVRSQREDEALEVLQLGYAAAGNDLKLGLALVQAQTLEGQLEAAAATMQELDAESATYLVRLDRDSRIRLEGQLRLLRARLDVAQGNPRRAIPDLRAIIVTAESRPLRERSAEWAQAAGLLGQIHASLGQWDMAAEYWDRLAQVLPTELEILAPAVDALLNSGNYVKALDRMDAYARAAPLTGDLLLKKLQAHLAIQSRRPPDQRNWTEFEAALEAAKSGAGDRWELVFAEAEYLRSRRDDLAEAAELLRAAEAPHAGRPDFWRAATAAYQRLGRTDDAERALERYRDLATSPVEHALLRAAWLASQDEFQQAEEVLVNLESSLAPDEQRRVRKLQLDILAAAGRSEDAVQLVAPWIEADGADVELLKRSIELALAAGDLTTAASWEARLRAATNDGPDARFLHARRLMLDDDERDRAGQQELERLIASVRGERPEWYPILALSARYAELRGDKRQALADYQLAVNRGDQRPFTLQQLASLLYDAGRFDEAQQILTQLSAAEFTSPFLESMALEIAVQQDQPALALQMARQGVERSPQDPLRHLFLANLLSRRGERAEAVAVLRQAAEKFVDDPGVWSGFVTELIRAGQVDEARNVLAEIATMSRLTEDRQHVVAAKGYELLGDLPAASREYTAALERQPADTTVRLEFAKLLSRSDSRAAQEQLERVLQLDPLQPEARQELAVLLAATGREADWARASQLLAVDDNITSSQAATNDRLRALLLSRKGRTSPERLENCRAARMILQRRIETDTGPDDDLNHLLLAQIFEQEAALSGDISLLMAAHDQIRGVVDGGPPNAQRLSNYIEFLLRHGEGPDWPNPATATEPETTDREELRNSFLTTAEARLQELARLQPAASGGLDALVAALTARLLQARGSQAEARDRIAEYVDQQDTNWTDSNQFAQQCLQNGRLFASIGAHADAEKWYRQMMKVSPNAYVLVVQSLVAQDKRRKAAELCLEISDGKPGPTVAAVMAYVMTASDQEALQGLQDVRSTIQAVLEEHRDHVQLLQAAAAMLASQGEYDPSIKLFRRILQLDPDNGTALNNLATLLAETPNQLDEALRHIQRAIKVDGRQPSLVDTQGTILLKLGDQSRAIACLEEATAGGPSDARYYLHLAAAYQQAERLDEARRMLQRARTMGVEQFVLTADDRRQLATLEGALAAPSPTKETTL